MKWVSDLKALAPKADMDVGQMMHGEALKPVSLEPGDLPLLAGKKVVLSEMGSSLFVDLDPGFVHEHTMHGNEINVLKDQVLSLNKEVDDLKSKKDTTAAFPAYVQAGAMPVGAGPGYQMTPAEAMAKAFGTLKKLGFTSGYTGSHSITIYASGVPLAEDLKSVWDKAWAIP